jgi:hypothetical protein
MRISELLVHARWQHIDWHHYVLNLPDGKDGSRAVPLSPDAMVVLRELRERCPDAAPQERMFDTTCKALKKAWSTACKEAGVEEVRPHDLRHTAATRDSLESGGNVVVLRVIAGHKTLSMLNRYINVDVRTVASTCTAHRRPWNTLLLDTPEHAGPTGCVRCETRPPPTPNRQQGRMSCRLQTTWCGSTSADKRLADLLGDAPRHAWTDCIVSTIGRGCHADTSRQIAWGRSCRQA